MRADYPGVLPEDVANNVVLPWFDLEALERAWEECKGDVAALIAQPYDHGNFFDKPRSLEEYWQGVRDFCDRHGMLLIIDDVRAGFRLDLAGSDHYYGFKADLICFCKALANGYNMSAVCGPRAVQDHGGVGDLHRLLLDERGAVRGVHRLPEQAQKAGRARAVPPPGHEADRRLQGGGRGARLRSGGVGRARAVLPAHRQRRQPDAASGVGGRVRVARPVPGEPSQPLHQRRAPPTRTSPWRWTSRTTPSAWWRSATRKFGAEIAKPGAPGHAVGALFFLLPLLRRPAS